MIHAIHKHNSEIYSGVLQQMWRQRHDVFIKKLGWKLATNGKEEVDHYDNEDAVYLVRLDDGGKLRGSVRLLPTSGRHLMSDHFTELCAEGVPTGDTIWEISRFYSLTARHNRLDKDITMNEIVVGLMEYAQANKVEKLTCVASMSLFPTLLGAGWDIDPLGLPKITDGELILAFCINITDEGIKKVRRNRGISHQVLIQLNESSQKKVAAI